MRAPLTRRDFVGAAAAAISLPLLPDLAQAEHTLRAVVAAADALPRGIDDDLMAVTIARLHALYAQRKYTTTVVTHWYLARIARYNGVYRALSHVDATGALATAAALDAGAKRRRLDFTAQPLWGVPIVIKANTSVHGLVTSAGWWGYVLPGEELVAPEDATVVARLRRAGAIILGQTNMPDFAASDTTFSTAYGRTGNAYNVRCSPGGSSGGTVTAVTADLCVLGTGTDTGNSIRMPAATSSLVGVLPTRGLTSIAGIQPLDWLRDNTGPIARDVTDAVTALDVMAGPDPRDARTEESRTRAQAGPYTKYLSAHALAGKRFGVPAFIVRQGTPDASDRMDPILHPDTRALFMKSLDGIRAAGGTVVIDNALLPMSFPDLVRQIDTGAYRGEGTEHFLRDYGPAAWHSTAEYAQVVGTMLPAYIRGVMPSSPGQPSTAPAAAPQLETDPDANSRYYEPRQRALAAFENALATFHLDGLVYPAIQMPPNDELQDLAEGRQSAGPHSATAWVNPIGVPAVVVPGGFYDDGLPFGLEFCTSRWRDGNLLGWAFAYEQVTKYRRTPKLVTRR